MSQQAEYSLAARYTVILIFVVAFVASVIWSSTGTINLISAISNSTPRVVFDLSSFYMPGIAIISAALLFDFVYETVKKQSLPARPTRYVVIAGVIGLIVLLVMPQLVRIGVNNHLTAAHYRLCEPASYQWFIYKKLVYTQTEQDCVSEQK